MIDVEMIADSISITGKRMRTMVWTYPRMIHSEVMTHNMLSKNASSSRAIPVGTMIANLRKEPAMPVYWGKNQKGMQANEELSPENIEKAKELWLFAMEDCINQAELMIELGVHKQIANRILEPWAHMRTVISGTDWDNMYWLRRDKDAQPEFKALADLSWEVTQQSVPVELNEGEWHLPFITREDWFRTELIDDLKNVSAARCARTSYRTFDGRLTSFEEDMDLVNKLFDGSKVHASPFEHQGSPDPYELSPDLWGNLRGWIQYRQQIPGHYVEG